MMFFLFSLLPRVHKCTESYSKARQTALAVSFNYYHMSAQSQHHKADVFSRPQLAQTVP